MASTVTVTATIQDPSGTDLTSSISNAYLRFRLRGFQGFTPQVQGTSIVVEPQVDAVPNGSGIVSQALWPNDAITPSSTFYTVEAWSQGRIIWSNNYLFNGNTDLSSASPINVPPVPPGFELVLEHNGTLNSSQSTLNLENTDGSIVITDEGGGTLNLQAVEQNALSTAGQGFFFGSGYTEIPQDATASATVVTTANEVRVQQFTLHESYTIRSLAVNIAGNVSAQTVSFGIYSASGNKLIDSGAISATNTGVQTATLASPVTLASGVYYFAQSASSASVTVPSISNGLPNNLIATFNAVNTYNGVAANVTSGGVLPTTLGALTPTNTSSPEWTGVAAPLWMV